MSGRRDLDVRMHLRIWVSQAGESWLTASCHSCGQTDKFAAKTQKFSTLYLVFFSLIFPIIVMLESCLLLRGHNEEKARTLLNASGFADFRVIITFNSLIKGQDYVTGHSDDDLTVTKYSDRT
eukprot:1379973-Amorphochlora_amoeboformis.AAC.1